MNLTDLQAIYHLAENVDDRRRDLVLLRDRADHALAKLREGEQHFAESRSKLATLCEKHGVDIKGAFP